MQEPAPSPQGNGSQGIKASPKFHTSAGEPASASPLTHAIFLSSLIIPFAILPYIAIARHLRGLRASATEVRKTTIAIQKELRTTLLENVIRKEEQERLQRVAEDMKGELKELKARLESARLAQVAGESAVRDLERRIDTEKEWRSQKLGLVRELGGSLAEVAAFMHEVELRHGLMPKRRGIERIRQLALKLQDGSQLTERSVPLSKPAPPLDDHDDRL